MFEQRFPFQCELQPSRSLAQWHLPSSLSSDVSASVAPCQPTTTEFTSRVGTGDKHVQSRLPGAQELRSSSETRTSRPQR